MLPRSPSGHPGATSERSGPGSQRYLTGETPEKPASSLQAGDKATMGPNLRLLSEFPVGTIRRTMVGLVPPLSDDLRRDLASDLDLVVRSLGPVRGGGDGAGGVALRPLLHARVGDVFVVQTAGQPAPFGPSKAPEPGGSGGSSLPTARAKLRRCRSSPSALPTRLFLPKLSPRGGAALKPMPRGGRRRGRENGKGSLKPPPLFNQHFLRPCNVERFTSEENA